jgi:hypothetical protein
MQAYAHELIAGSEGAVEEGLEQIVEARRRLPGRLVGHVSQSFLPRSDGQSLGFPCSMLPHREHAFPDDPKARTPTGFPISLLVVRPLYDDPPDSDNACRSFEASDLRPQSAGHRLRKPEFLQQLLKVFLRRRQRLRPAAVPFVRKEFAVNLFSAMQPHKETVRAMRRLINPANARGL